MSEISELPAATEGHADDRFETTQVDGATLVSRSITLEQVSDAVAAVLPPPVADWDSITGKPSTFPPTVPIAWTDVSGKPATFPPTLPIPESGVTNLVSDLAAKAPLASPTFTGDPKAPTPTAGDNDTSIATTAFVTTAVAAIPAVTVPAGTVAFGGVGGAVTGNSTLAWDNTSKNLSITGYTGTGSGFFASGSVPASPASDVFRMDVVNASNNTGNIFRLRSGPSSGGLLDAFKVDMAGDASMSGSCQALGSSGLVAGGAIYFGYFLGNFSGGTLGLWGGTGAPTFSTGGKKGGLYLDTTGAIPWYNVDGGTTWARLGGSVTASTTAPASPTDGQLWYNSDASAGGGALYIRYNDGNTTQWVPASPAASGIVGASSLTNFLAADVALNNTANFFDIANTGSIGAAGQVWAISARAQFRDAAAANVELALFNGSAYVTALADRVDTAAGQIGVALSPVVVTLSAATTFTLRAKNITSTTGTVQTTGNATGIANRATYLTAIRLA